MFTYIPNATYFIRRASHDETATAIRNVAAKGRERICKGKMASSDNDVQ